MQVGVGYSDITDSTAAGTTAAAEAISLSNRTDPCDIVLLFCTARHNQELLRASVAKTVGGSVPIYGGGAVGIITNEAYGYAGHQVGVVCIWLDGVTCDVLVDNGLLSDGEEKTGLRLGKGLSELGVSPDSSVMLFYEAIGRNDNTGFQMMMATWILNGLKEALGFWPNLTGAGLMGDHACSYTGEFTKDRVGNHSAIAFSFGNGIRIDSTIMHGCHPASEYYTVTKSDGPVILEINHKPALIFIDELLGSAINPEQYPFSLLFGINSGDRWGEYKEENYASRLCLGIDRERGGIVMFEPDMVEGTEFQLMFRSTPVEYMKVQIESAFRHLNGRKPVFAIYIDCAGRCAGYGGAAIEDALVLQEVVAGRVPLFGIYTGVEIAPVNGIPRGLDWTGVLCLFSEEGEEGGGIDPKSSVSSSFPNPKSLSPSEYIMKLCKQNAAKVFALDTQSIALRYELELKRRGFSLLSELSASLRGEEDDEDMFLLVAQRLNAALNMQKTILLLADGSGMFSPVVLQGFDPADQSHLMKRSFPLPDESLALCPAIVTPDNSSGTFARLSEEYALPFFIASPVYVQNKAAALLLTGRLVEQEPYLTRLNRSDLETVQAISDLIGSVLVQRRLQDISVQAETDGLTGLWNRTTFKQAVEHYLSKNKQASGVFMLIDIDNFKSVNDSYGHITGDNVLQSCAGILRSVLRGSDIIGRLGGDEFVVFCEGLRSQEVAEKRAQQLLDAWRNAMPSPDGKKQISVSIGISRAPNHGISFQELYDTADVALYKAKEQGKNCYMFFGSSKK